MESVAAKTLREIIDVASDGDLDEALPHKLGSEAVALAALAISLLKKWYPHDFDLLGMCAKGDFSAFQQAAKSSAHLHADVTLQPSATQ